MPQLAAIEQYRRRMRATLSLGRRRYVVIDRTYLQPIYFVFFSFILPSYHLLVPPSEATPLKALNLNTSTRTRFGLFALFLDTAP